MVAKPHQPGKWRFCVDYRKLNESLQSMGWPIPNFDRLFTRLGAKKAKFFAVLDLTSGYHQVLLDPNTRHLAAFITDFGVFEPVRLWMGIKSAPSYFQQRMTYILHGLIYSMCEIYIDDIIIFGRTETEFLEHLGTVLQRLREYGLTLNPDKAQIGLTALEYVGRVINEHGVVMSDEKIRKVVEFPLPFTPKQLKQFLGLVNYFRAHVRGFAITATPLYELTEGYHLPHRRRSALNWTPRHVHAFEAIKDAIRANPLLHFLDDQLPITVATDASDFGIGAYLYQCRHDATGDVEIPVAFLSQALTDVQRRWSTIEKECYAIWFALRKWEHLLRDVHFTILTDHRNLQFLNTNTPKVVRWKMAVQEFDFTVRHIDGEKNVVADAFSRLCVQDGEVDDAPLDSKGNRALVSEGGVTTDRLCVLNGICPCSEEDMNFLCGVAQSEPPKTATPTSDLDKGRRSRRSGKRARFRKKIKLRERNSRQVALAEATQTLPSPTEQEGHIHNLHDVTLTDEQFQTITSVHNEMEGHMGFSPYDATLER